MLLEIIDNTVTELAICRGTISLITSFQCLKYNIRTLQNPESYKDTKKPHEFEFHTIRNENLAPHDHLTPTLVPGKSILQ